MQIRVMRHNPLSCRSSTAIEKDFVVVKADITIDWTKVEASRAMVNGDITPSPAFEPE